MNKFKYLYQYLSYTVDDFLKLAGLAGPKDVKYSELVDLIQKKKLKAGQQYRITDYQTVHYLVTGSYTQYVDVKFTGDLEPLIVTATSPETLDIRAVSQKYPQDIIHYDWNPNNWKKDTAFCDMTTDSQNPTIIPNFKGVIYFRHDTALDNSFGYDFRNVKFRRWGLALTPWSSTQTYYKRSTVVVDDTLYFSLKDNNLNHPVTDTTYWFPYIGGVSSSPLKYAFSDILSTNSSDYIDVKTFVEGDGSAKYELCCRNNHFEPVHDNRDMVDTTSSILTNNVFFLKDVGYYSVYDNEFGYGFSSNTVYVDYFSSNTFQEYISTNAFVYGQVWYNTFRFGAKRNIFKSFQMNQVANAFTNTFGDQFKSNSLVKGFSNNIIGDNSAFNTFGVNFDGNFVSGSMQYNQIGNEFQNNTIKFNFKYNTITNGIYNVNFNNATHVYANYDCTIIKRQDLSYILTYYDNTNTRQVVAITA